MGRVYPYSLRAATVQNLLLDACRALGVRLVTGCRVEKIIPGFTVQTDKGAFAGDKVVLERLEQPGKKLLATGNGRCNLTNMQAPHSRAVLDAPYRRIHQE